MCLDIADDALEVLRIGCFKYFEQGGECINGPVSLLAGCVCVVSSEMGCLPTRDGRDEDEIVWCRLTVLLPGGECGSSERGSIGRC